MTTGLQEGSVLSPLLFILFMADMRDSVLRPFGSGEFLKNDPSLNAIPVPGLLYAGNLVLFCQTADLLRERLRRLSWYADNNSLTVNVGKCEISVRLRETVTSCVPLQTSGYPYAAIVQIPGGLD